MDRTLSEKIMSGIAYAITLVGVLPILAFVMGGEWLPGVVAIFGAASAAVVVLYWRGSRYVLVHAINACLLSLAGVLLSMVPLAVAAAVRHGYLLPRPVGVNQIWFDPVPYTLGAACIFIGLPLMLITYEALADALQGEFLEHWPPLRWLRDWLLRPARSVKG